MLWVILFEAFRRLFPLAIHGGGWQYDTYIALARRALDWDVTQTERYHSILDTWKRIGKR